MIFKKVTLFLLMALQITFNCVVAQTNSQMAGLGWSMEGKYQSLKLTYLHDSNKRFQIEGAVSFSKDFESNHERYGVDLFPALNIYLKKRTIASRKFYVTGSIGPYFQYYTRNFDIITEDIISPKLKRFAVGILPGVHLNWNFAKRFVFRLDYKYGYSIYWYYGPSCKSGQIFSECYENYPTINLLSTSFIFLNLFYKF